MNMKDVLSEDNRYPDPLMDWLFCPKIDVLLWPSLTVEQAVCAIDAFLAGAGAECWPMALQDIPLA